MTRWGIGFTAIRIVEEYIYGSRQVSNEIKANFEKDKNEPVCEFYMTM
jgi:hypothetical protein